TIDSLVDGMAAFRLVPVGVSPVSSMTSSSATAVQLQPQPQLQSKEPCPDNSVLIEYEFVKLATVSNVWKEWKLEVGGQPPIEELEKKFKVRWCKTDKARQAFHCRKVL
ncbi:hypothetical protein EC973_008518, partial [Apophysomyces ossiformis]